MAACLLLIRRRFLPYSRTNSILIPAASYVDVTMKWKKDPSFDAVDILSSSSDLRPLLSLKNIILAGELEPLAGIPVSTVSKLNRRLEIPGRVASLLRRYPSFFHEFTGPFHNHPWFRLTPSAFALHHKELRTYESHKGEIVDRLRRLILMSPYKRLPLRIVQGMLWSLGLPHDFLSSGIGDARLWAVEMGDGDTGLSTEWEKNEVLLSALERHSIKQVAGEGACAVTFPLFPSKGLRLKKKIEDWLEHFQKLPYISPYNHSFNLDPCSDVSEKRVVGLLHELLGLFVDCSAERRSLLCLRTHLRLPQKFGKAFERHPHVFYLLLKNKTCTVVLKEAYRAGLDTGIETHPMLPVRKEYVQLMRESDAILRSRRRSNRISPDNDDQSWNLRVGAN